MSIRTELQGPRGVTVGCIFFAVAYAAIGIATSDPWIAIAGPVIMLGYLGVLFAFRSRSEPVALLAGATSDERRARLMTLACAAVGNVLVLAVIVGFFWALAVGNQQVAHVLAGLGAIGGATFAVAVFWLSRHR